MRFAQIVQGRLREVTEYVVPHAVIRAPASIEGGQVRYPVGNRLVRVEEYAAHILQQCGLSVYRGDDAHLFLSVLSCNFKDSFFHQVFCNWVGAGAEKLVEQLDEAASRALAREKVDAYTIERAERALATYYRAYRPKCEVHHSIAQHLYTFDEGLVLRLLRFYRSLGYVTKGAPDLFAALAASFMFVEVKSKTDSLSAAQYAFFEGYLTSVGDNIVILRIVPEEKVS